MRSWPRRRSPAVSAPCTTYSRRSREPGACVEARGGRSIAAYLPEDEPQRSRVGAATARAIADRAARRGERGGGLIEEIDGLEAYRHAFAAWLVEAGFVASPQGLQWRGGAAPVSRWATTGSRDA